MNPRQLHCLTCLSPLLRAGLAVAYQVCALWNTNKNSATVKQPNALMKDAKSTTGGSVPCRTLRTLRTNVHVKKAVIKTVPMKASNAAPLSIMAGV